MHRHGCACHSKDNSHRTIAKMLVSRPQTNRGTLLLTRTFWHFSVFCRSCSQNGCGKRTCETQQLLCLKWAGGVGGKQGFPASCLEILGKEAIWGNCFYLGPVTPLLGAFRVCVQNGDAGRKLLQRVWDLQVEHPAWGLVPGKGA